MRRWAVRHCGRRYLGRPVLLLRLCASIMMFMLGMLFVRHVLPNPHQHQQGIRVGDQAVSCDTGTHLVSMATGDLRNAARTHAENHSLIVSVVPATPYSDQLAISFYRGSILKLNITNFFFVAIADDTCSRITSHCTAPCYLAGDLLGGSRSHACSVRTRLELVLQLLLLEVKVLHVDTDVYFFKNPLDHLNHTLYDIETPPAALNNSFMFDFFLIRPTSCSITVIHSLLIEEAFPCAQDNRRDVMKQPDGCFEVPSRLPLKIFALNRRYYPDSYYYFDKYERHFAGGSLPCQECVIVHNNMSTTKQIRYRFMEAHMWHFDDAGYYSNQDARYLIFDNPLETETDEITIQNERSALVSALAIGQILGRIVLLPKLHHWGIWCPFSSHYDIDVFDREFGGKYRENTFLRNPLVPANISSRLTTPLLIDSSSDCFMYYTLSELNATHIYSPKETQHGANSLEIKQWFSGLSNIPVLNFRCLYNAFSNFTDETEEKRFKEKVDSALVFKVIA